MTTASGARYVLVPPMRRIVVSLLLPSAWNRISVKSDRTSWTPAVEGSLNKSMFCGLMSPCRPRSLFCLGDDLMVLYLWILCRRWVSPWHCVSSHKGSWIDGIGSRQNLSRLPSPKGNIKKCFSDCEYAAKALIKLACLVSCWLKSFNASNSSLKSLSFPNSFRAKSGPLCRRSQRSWHPLIFYWTRWI